MLDCTDYIKSYEQSIDIIIKFWYLFKKKMLQYGTYTCTDACKCKLHVCVFVVVLYKFYLNQCTERASMQLNHKTSRPS